MTFKFPIALNDTYEVRTYEFTSTKSFRRLVLFERIAGIGAIAFIVYIFRASLSQMPAFILFLGLCLVWVVGFPYIMKIRLKSHAKKELREAGETAPDGEIRVSFGENLIEQEAPGKIIRRVAYSRVVWVEDAKKYVLIYDQVNPTPIIIVSKEVFESDDERQRFVRDLRDRCDITVENKYAVLKQGPRLKVKKR